MAVQEVIIKYIATQTCLVHGRLFKVGEQLRPHWVPKPNKEGKFPSWFKHFEPEADAEITILAKRNIELGIDPARDKKVRARAAALHAAAEGIEDHTKGVQDTLDFLYVTDDEVKDFTKTQMADALEQLGVDIKKEDYSKADLLQMGRDAALSAK